ncbi:MAG: FG-GAP repeat protein [Bacteroidia bacterium]|nr:FG-GAP repeat protein [Bacteroidia bacterium]MCO5253749.1 FG-GAP-like repeat-containing protein [Bacteroidota bacterium]
MKNKKHFTGTTRAVEHIRVAEALEATRSIRETTRRTTAEQWLREPQPPFGITARLKTFFAALAFTVPLFCFSQENGEVKSMQINTVNLASTVSYGASVASYNGNIMIAGSQNGTGNGEVFIHKLNSNGTIQSTVRITRNVGGFGDHNISGHAFGWAVVNIGDLNGDGIDDIAVGAPNFNSQKGSLWFLYLDADGQVIGERRLSDTTAGFQHLSNQDRFGRSITNVGDIDGNGYDDIVVGAPYQNHSTTDNGSVYIILLEKFGVVKSYTRVNDNNSLFARSHWNFGQGVANIGDIDGDGNTDLAVGEPGVNEALWILFLNSDGTLKGVQEIGEGKGGFTDSFNVGSNFGHDITNLGDIDGDGVNDIAVGEMGYTNSDSSGNLYGRVWVLLLNANGTVKKNIEIGNGTGGFTGNIKSFDRFGWSVARLPDLDGDSVPELAVGSTNSDAATAGLGAVYILFLKGVPQVSVPHIAAPIFQAQAYPNPANSILHINLSQAQSGSVSLQLLDIQGRAVKTQHFPNAFEEMQLDISDHCCPIYF